MTLAPTRVGATRLSAAALDLGYADRPVVQDLNLAVPDG